MDKNDHIFVTGATGLVGSYIVRHLLQQGFNKITALYRNNSKLDHITDIKDRVNWVKIDLLEADQLQDAINSVDYVFHAAAMVTFDPHQRHIMFRSNVEGTANIVNACLSADVKKLIYTSSIAALGRNEQDQLIDETNEWQESPLNSDYGKSKLLAEMEVWRGSEEGLNIAIVNPSVVLGTGDWSRSSLQLFKKVQREFPYYPAGGNGFVDVRDVAELTVKIGANDLTNERVILSAGNYSLKEIMEMIASFMQVSPPRKPLPGWMLNVIPPLERIRSAIFLTSPLMTRTTMRVISNYSKYDNSKSIEKLGAVYRPIETTIRDCVEIFISGGHRPLSF